MRDYIALLTAVNTWVREVGATLYDVAEQQKQLVDAFSTLQELLLESVKGAKEDLENQLTEHDCHASPEDGCECGPAREQLAEVNRLLNLL